MGELTLNGTKGLEMTREEVIDIFYKIKAVIRKAQCREVNQEVIGVLNNVIIHLGAAERTLTEILESNEG